jgi:hypothetical protein
VTEPLAELADDAPEELEGGFSRRALAWIVGSVAISLIATVLLTAYGRDLEPPPVTGASSFSDSALGHRAVVSFLGKLGLGVASRQAPADGIGPGRPLVLAEPDPDGRNWRPERLEALRQEALARKAPLILVLPKWRAGGPRKSKPGWLASVRLIPERTVLGPVEALQEPDLHGLVLRRFTKAESCSGQWPGASGVKFRVEIESPQLIQPAAQLQPLVSCAGGLLAARRAAIGSAPEIVLIVDPDLLNNQGLGRGENAVVIYQLLTRGIGATGAVFDETIHGFNRTPGLLAEALSFPLVLGVLQALVLAGVVLWAGMGRFGKPLPAGLGLAAGKEVLIDNTAKLLVNGGHAADSAARYFRQTTRAVAAHYFLPPDLPDSERLASLQRITAHHGDRLSLAELERSLQRLPAGQRGEEQAARIARRLHNWRVEMTNVH